MFAAFLELLPVAIGVVMGLCGVSLLLRPLARFPKFIFGVLLGIDFVGAMIGLWPFGRYVPPEVGDVIRGVIVTHANRAIRN